MSNPNFDALLATTLAKYGNKLTDNVFNDRPLANWLRRKDRTRMVNGGHEIVEQLIYGRGGSGTYSGWDQIAIAPVDGITAAQFPWKQHYATIAINGLEEAQNNGEEEIIDLLEAKIMQAEETAKDDFNEMFYGDGTGNGGKDWLGLDALIGDDTTTVTTVGGIDCTAVGSEYWRSVVATNNVAVPGTPLALDPDRLANAWNSAAKGNDKVTAMFTTQTIYETYESLLTQNVRYEDVESANLGFTNLMFKSAPIFFDDDCTAEAVYGINDKYLRLVGHKNRWFKQSGFSDGTASAHASSGAANTVDGKYALITTYGNLTVKNRARHFRLIDCL